MPGSGFPIFRARAAGLQWLMDAQHPVSIAFGHRASFLISNSAVFLSESGLNFGNGARQPGLIEAENLRITDYGYRHRTQAGIP